MPYNYFISKEDNENKMPEWGLARTSLVIDATRDEVANSMLFDNGDLIQGSPMGDYMAAKGVDHLRNNHHPVYKAMNHLDYDAANLGNHEFNYGLEYLDEALKGSNFPYVSANVWKNDNSLEKVSNKAEECEIRITEEMFDIAEHMYDPYVILERDFIGSDGKNHSVNVGVIGFTPPDIMGWDASHLVCNVLVSDIKKTAEHYVPIMKAEGADVIVAIPHSGLNNNDNEFAENASLHLGYVEGIDAIMFGHDHREFPNQTGEYGDIPDVDAEKGLINGVPAVMPGYWGAKLGVIDLKLRSENNGETWVVDHTHSTTELRSLVEGSDATIEDLVEEEHEGTVEYMAETIAEIDVNMNSFFPQLVPDLSIQVVNEAQLHQLLKWKEDGEFASADENALFLSVSAPFKSGRNGPADYTNIQEGELTNASVADIYVFDNNTPAVLKLSGADMKRWIEWVNSNAYNTLPLAGNERFLIESFPGYNFDVFYGGFSEEGEGRLKYTVNVENNSKFTEINGTEFVESDTDYQIESLTFDGVDIADDAEIYVITNNYRASNSAMPGIDNAEIVKEEAAFNNRELVQFYLADRLEQEASSYLAFPNAEVFQLIAPNTDSVEFASATLKEATRCATGEITGLSTKGDEGDKDSSEGFTMYKFDFNYDGEFNCSAK